MGRDGDGEEQEQISFLSDLPSSSSSSNGRPPFKRTGGYWSAVAHIITAVIGSGVLSLAWSLSQLGWVAGPLAMVIFAGITSVSSILLSDCYRSPDPETGLTRNRTYVEAVKLNLGKSLYLLFFSSVVLVVAVSAAAVGERDNYSCYLLYT